jgi:hypothetical protein
LILSGTGFSLFHLNTAFAGAVEQALGFPFQIFGTVHDLYKTLTISRKIGYVGDIKGWFHTSRPRSAPIDTDK